MVVASVTQVVAAEMAMEIVIEAFTEMPTTIIKAETRGRKQCNGSQG